MAAKSTLTSSASHMQGTPLECPTRVGRSFLARRSSSLTWWKTSKQSFTMFVVEMPLLCQLCRRYPEAWSYYNLDTYNIEKEPFGNTTIYLLVLQSLRYKLDGVPLSVLMRLMRLRLQRIYKTSRVEYRYSAIAYLV